MSIGITYKSMTGYYLQEQEHTRGSCITGKPAPEQVMMYEDYNPGALCKTYSQILLHSVAVIAHTKLGRELGC